MADKVLIIGESGSGKSYSMRNLDPSETFYICPDEKDLPFKGGEGKYVTQLKDNNKVDWEKSNRLETTSPEAIRKTLMYISKSRPDIKVVVIDTITQMMTDEFMSRSQEGGWGKFTEMAKNPYDIMKIIRKLRPDLTVVVFAHSEADERYGETFTRMFVPGGKLLKEKAKPEAIFTTVLETYVEHGDGGDNEESKYYFRTQNRGDGIAKSPGGLFNEYLISNDLKFVLDQIKNYKNQD